MKNKKVQLIAKNVIQDEIKALKKIKLSIGNSFNQIIKTILNCKNGKIIISGVGKSGIIGKKLIMLEKSFIQLLKNMI